MPDWVTSFSYSVIATNSAGSATAGPYTVYLTHHHARIDTYLSCPPRVHADGTGSCTLSVTDLGGSPAPNVTAQVSLPWPLRARSCSQDWQDQGYTISGNTASENFGTLSPGQTRTLSVVFVAKSGRGIWGFHRYHVIPVKVTGFAASDQGYWGFGARGYSTAYSTAYVTIVPRGWWWDM